jgi:DNA-binding Lrp family transcriptional regulator
MNLETLNPYVLKILIAIRKEDSVIGISRRINLSFGWTYKWVKELVKEGIIKERWRGIVLQEDNKTYKRILKFIKEIRDIRFYYSVLNLFGIRYCFEKTDAVYIWTEGRYNIARYREFYPIFIMIKKEDYHIFLRYCRKLNLKIRARKGIFYVPEVVEDFKFVKKDDLFVEPLNETIEFMKKNIYNFQPALEMIQEMYGRKLGIKYKEI